MTTDDPNFESELQDLLAAGKKIEAIKLYRERTGVGLAEAKKAVEAMEREEGVGVASLEEAEEVEGQIVELLRQRRKIEAVKVCRKQTGLGLKESKELVEALAAKHGLEAKSGGGCLGVVLLFALLFVAGAAWAKEAGSPNENESPRPNFVIVLADDLGYGDLACFGHPLIKTPNLDRLAEAGMKLTNCYAASANCSPARTGLMTGRTPYRVGVHNWIPHLSPMHMPRDEITVATLLRNAGYATCQTGKWHMTGRFNLPGQPQPGDHGFDHWFATQNNALPNHHNPDNFVRNGEPVGKIEGYSADIVVDEAVDWLTNVRPKDKPFFLYVCFHEPHEPIATAERYAKMYPSPDPSLSAHHGNVTQMDAAFGRLIRTVDDLGLAQNTVVFFTSDNGPARTRIHPHGSTGGLREKKGSLYEGGIRVPGIVRWPGHVRPGSVSDEPICGVDLLPTLCEIAGIPVPSDRAIDGTSILPLLDDRPVQRKTPLYWQFNFARSKPKVVMRIGDWKIVADLTTKPLKPTADIRPEHRKALKEAELTAFELYNLRDDAGETTDLAAKEPQRLREMAAQLRELHSEVRNESPVWPEWKSPHYESKRIKWPEYRAGR